MGVSRFLRETVRPAWTAEACTCYRAKSPPRINAPDVLQQLESEGVVAICSTPAQFAAHIKKQHARVPQVVKSSAAKFE